MTESAPLVVESTDVSTSYKPDDPKAAAREASQNVPLRCARPRQNYLVKFEQLPRELQTNPHIRGSYRRHGLTVWETAWSLMPYNLHTETVNVWSHVIGERKPGWLLCPTAQQLVVIRTATRIASVSISSISTGCR